MGVGSQRQGVRGWSWHLREGPVLFSGTHWPWRLNGATRVDDQGLMTNFNMYWDGLTGLMMLGLFPPPPTAIESTSWGQVKASHGR